MSNKKPISWLIALNLLLFCGFGIHHLYKLRQYNDANTQTVNYVAGEYEKLGLMPQEDYRRIAQLGYYIKQTNKISDDDLDWWIHFVNQSETSNLDKQTQMTRRSIALANNWAYLTKVTPQQKDKLFELAKRYLPPQVNSKGKEMMFGVILVAYMDEKRAAPLLIPLLDRPQGSIVRQVSERLLKKWSLPRAS